MFSEEAPAHRPLQHLMAGFVLVAVTSEAYRSTPVRLHGDPSCQDDEESSFWSAFIGAKNLIRGPGEEITSTCQHRHYTWKQSTKVCIIQSLFPYATTRKAVKKDFSMMITRLICKRPVSIGWAVCDLRRESFLLRRHRSRWRTCLYYLGPQGRSYPRLLSHSRILKAVFPMK